MIKFIWLFILIFSPLVSFAGMGGPIGLQVIAGSTVVSGETTNWVLADSDSANAANADNISTPALTVSAGDLIVVAATTTDDSAYATNFTDGSNSYTLRDVVATGGSNKTVRIGYVISANAGPTTITTVGLDSYCNKTITAFVFTPDSGATEAFDVGASNFSGWEAAPWETAECNPQGTYDVCVAFFQGNGTTGFSSPEIPNGTAADGTETQGGTSGAIGFYKILTSPSNGLEAEVTPDETYSYACEVVCFKYN